jgi:ABC-type multidrug transport system fused ATPase/permease subunit
MKTDEALASFHNIMAMETFSLFDDEQQSSLRDDLNLNEVYKTRLLRVDLGTRSRTDPFQRWLHRYLRAFRYWRLAGKLQNHNEESIAGRRHRWSYQNTVLVADIMGRITTVALMVAFLIAPLVILSRQSSKDTQLVVVSICIFTLSSLVSFFLKVSSFEMMAISAAYTAVLTVFISNNAEKAL